MKFHLLIYHIYVRMKRLLIFRFLHVQIREFSSNILSPSPFPSPRWGEGKGEGKISNMFGLVLLYQLQPYIIMKLYIL